MILTKFLKRGPPRSRKPNWVFRSVTAPAPGDESPVVSGLSLDRNPHPAMYESFYNLDHAPFPASPDPAALVIYGDLGTQLGELAGCLTSGQGIAVMTGPAGSGKTICTLAMIRDLTTSLVGVCLRTGQFDQPGALLKAILHGLGRPYRQQDDQDLRLAVADAILGLPATADGVLLAVDEAHRLALPVLEELRGLTNYDAEGRPLVRLLLAGHCSLDEKLAEQGATVMRITAYENRPPASDSIDLPATLTEGRLDCVVFASPSSARNFLDVVGREQGLKYLRAMDIAVIGPTTAGAVEDLGLAVAIKPTDSSVPTLVRALCEHYGRP